MALDITLDQTVLDPVVARVDLAIRIGGPGMIPALRASCSRRAMWFAVGLNKPN
ncbi:hypothetical protein [Sulfitobacter sp.]|uniref:hypothetical protein n=1 Tax=Sulfitobacter sp. TaxID=1903071 RepID=UPI003F6BFD39